MVKILLAVDGSESSLRATRSLIETAQWFKELPQIELVTVHLPVPHVGGFSGVVINQEMVDRYYSEEGGKMLADARKLLDAAKVKYTPHILIGDIAHLLVDHAQKTGCQMLYLGTRGMTAMSNLVLGSVATKVLHLAHIPVVLVH